MKMKRMVCVILSILMMMSLFAGCQVEPDEYTDPPAVDGSEQDTTPSETQPTETQPNEKAEEIPEFDTTLDGIRVVVDGIVHNLDVQVADGAWYISAQDAQTAFGSTFSEEYVALDAYAKSADIRYEQDEVLTAAYFSTYQGYDGQDKHPIDMDWETSKWVDVTEDSVRTVNSDILTADLLTTAKKAPEITADDYPRWTGLVFGYEYSGSLNIRLFVIGRTVLHSAACGYFFHACPLPGNPQPEYRKRSHLRECLPVLQWHPDQTDP